jgi:Transposase IS66 family
VRGKSYALSQWQALTVFCADGTVSIDNNVSEREMKRVVLNRKNPLFVGNARGGRTAAILASLTRNCRRHDVDPQLYITKLLVNLPSTLNSQLATWLPSVEEAPGNNLLRAVELQAYSSTCASAKAHERSRRCVYMICNLFLHCDSN